MFSQLKEQTRSLSPTQPLARSLCSGCGATSRSTFRAAEAGVHIYACAVVYVCVSVCSNYAKMAAFPVCAAQDFRKFSEHMQNNGRQQHLYICHIDIYTYVYFIYMYTRIKYTPTDTHTQGAGQLLSV